MSPLRVAPAWIAAGLFAVAALIVVPVAMDAESLLAGEDDPAAIADRALATSFDRSVAIREIEAALAANDADLANSYLELARERGVAVPAVIVGQVKDAVDRANSTVAHVESFARGLITGEPENIVGLAGTTLGDLFVYGDIRDAVREGTRYVSGQPTDELVLGLSVVGLAITAGTYASAGAATPARVGLSAVKAGRGAILLSLATFNLAAWILGAILTLFGFVSSAKSGVERLTQRAIDRGKAKKREHDLAMMEQRA